ncbi:MAG: hypothetical protein ABI408_08435 [Gemmatimonadaceae bacterium]
MTYEDETRDDKTAQGNMSTTRENMPTTAASRDDPACWEALATRIHNAARIQAEERGQAARMRYIGLGYNEARFLADRAPTLSFLAICAAAASIIVAVELRTPRLDETEVQNMWASVLSSQSASGSLARLIGNYQVAPPLAALVVATEPSPRGNP